MCYVLDTRSMRGWCLDLDGFVGYELLEKTFSLLDAELGSCTADIERYYAAIFSNCLFYYQLFYSRRCVN